MARDINVGAIDQIRRMKQDVEEYKNRQFIGSNNLIVYRYEASPYSFSLGIGGRKRLDVTWTSSTQDYFLYSQAANTRYGATYESGTDQLLTTSNMGANILYDTPKSVRLLFFVDNLTGSAQTYWIKFYLQTSDRMISASVVEFA